MPGENTQEVAVAAGAYVGTAPAGTAEPVLVAGDPSTPWKDLGYITEDGITHTTARESEEFGAWQSQNPILVLVTGITDTFALAFRQWSVETFKFVYGGANALTPGPPASGKFTPSTTPPEPCALLLKWTWWTYPSQLWIPRGSIQGDTETILARTAPSDLACEVVSTPSGSEPVWTFATQHPAFAAGAAGFMATMAEDGTITTREIDEEGEAVA